MKRFTVFVLLLAAIHSNAQISKRWYSYTDYLDLTMSSGSMSYLYTNLWNTPTSVEVYSGPTFDTNNITSVAMSFAPRLNAWNDAWAFGSTIKVGPSDAFVIDSVRIHGIYQRNNAKALVKDTIRLSFVYGDGSATSNLPVNTFSSSAYPSAHYLGLAHDTARNIAKRIGTSTPAAYVQSVILSATDTATSFERAIALTTPLSVPAGNHAAVSLTFISGDASFVPYDTIRLSPTGPYKYGSFRPMFGYNSSSPGFPMWAPYNPSDSNVGYAVYEPFGSWLGWYVPTWAWYSGSTSTASVLQYPVIDFHISCTTCRLNEDITGLAFGSSICVGDAVAVLHGAPGGTWSSSNPAVATVGILSGILTGISGGTVNITYAIGTNFATRTFTVDPLPSPGTITGPATVCLGASVTMAGAPSFGTWSTTTGNATITSAGVVSGATLGTDIITYEVSNFCGTSSATKPITVITSPPAGTTHGASTVCVGSNITLTNTEAGGSWSASNGNAAVSGGGVVSGLTAGTVSITYTVSNACGSSSNDKVITVVNCSTGVNDITGEGDITIFPNPTSGNFAIHSAEPVTRVIVTNMVGQKVFEDTYNANDVTVSLSQLTPGLYFVKINESRLFKVAKQ